MGWPLSGEYMAKEDLILIHAPSVYDFRKESLFYGPVSDLVPSTPVFEMYPFGFTTMAVQLAKAGYRVRLINLASMMLNDRNLDVEKYLSRLDSEVFGLDLHWLPHAHGSLAIAEMIRRLHPNSKILFGGFSSSYFHEELIQYPQVDLILRGDSTEMPLLQLMDTLEKRGDLSAVPNLTWKDKSGIHANEISYVPTSMDHLDIDYGWIVRSVIRHRDLEGAKPFKDWDRYPITSVFTVRGCSLSCVVCGGSCGAMGRVLGRNKPAFRSPEKAAQDIANVEDYINAPVFVVGDIRQNGMDYADRFFTECRRLDLDSHVVLELFAPASESFFREANRTFSRYSVQFSPDSHDERVRYALGRRFDNAGIESSISAALNNDCRRFDIFFMIGLPEQTRESALESADYTRRLYDQNNNDHRLAVYTSPLAPFLDPGSIAFENPERFGYRVFARTLEEHRKRLPLPNWKDVLSYETLWMDRDTIAETSYDAADRLSDVRRDIGLITDEEHLIRSQRSREARQLLVEVDNAIKLPENERIEKMMQLKIRGEELMESTICQKRDLVWDAPSIIRSLPRAAMGVLRGRSRRQKRT
ncbi:MAG: TIGR04190 family B12-binding domain/radical SAM domain protein [Euryarchaeota archaeon]|nr:TIGR04190 family B12-binding domain/radical SAM domain protein [Euryarchaeota archaeon]